MASRSVAPPVKILPRQGAIGACLLLVALLFGPASSYGDFAKRGWAGSEQSKVEGTNAGWFYDWSDVNAEAVTSDAEFVPMFYSAADVTPERIAEVAVNYPDATHILGMNEPDQPSQGVSTVAEALAAWPLIESTGLRTVSPANLSDGGGRAWSRSFLNQAETLGYRVDVVGVHWYGNFFSVDYTNPEETAARFLTDIESWWDEYQKPLWITEFGVRDTSDQIDPALIGGHNERFLEIVLPALDNLDYVERYAWFQWEHDLRLMGGNPQTPTPLGEIYAGAARPGVTIDFRAQNRGDDILYLRGGVITNDYRPGDAGGRYLQVLASEAGEVGVLRGVSDWTIADGYFWSRPGSAVRKEGANEVVIHNSDIFHSGAIEIAEGTIRLSGSTTINGVGSLTLLPGGALRLGGADDLLPMNVNRSLQLRGGDLVVPAGAPGQHVLEGSQALLETTRFDIEGQLELRGSLTGPGNAGIVKSGPGLLRLTADSPFAGDTLVEAGVLAIGFNVSLEASPRIEIAAGAEIDASSRRLGLAIGAGRTLSAGSGATVRGLLDLRDGGTLELILADASVHEPLSVVRSLNAAGALVVTLAEDADAPQAGDAFDLFDTPTLVGSFASIDLPTLDDGLTWNDDALLGAGILQVALVGDYNADGRVDAADYTVWRDRVGDPDLPNRDPVLTGVVGDGDYAVWATNLGRTTPPAAPEAVPEPLSLSIALLTGVLVVVLDRRGRN